MAKPKTDSEADRIEAARPVARVVAPGGDRRRAGFSFSAAPRELTAEEIIAAGWEVEDFLKALFADPQLSVTPVI